MEDPKQPSSPIPSRESGSTPIAPRKLRPPGSEEESGDGDGTHTDASFISEDGHLHGVDGHDYGEAHEVHPETGERVFIVGEGEAVHVQEKPPATKEKLSAVLMAVVVHVVIAVLLTVVYLTSPPPPPPQISVSAIANGESSIEGQTMKKVTQRTASTTSSSAPIVSSTAFSNFSVPTMTDASSTLTMVAMSDGDAGFGMSMSGFGDVSNMAAIPAGMQSRCSMSQRMKRLRESGGEDRCERAVREGLEFISKKQNKEDGSFGEEFTAAMTGLALLAYLGHCETPESPKFGDSVVNAALFLMDRALKSEGRITNGKSGHHEAYEHAIATYALCELYSMTKESGKEIPRLESVLKKAVGVIVDGQTKLGGWPYGFKGEGKEDMSVSGWQIQALKAAYNTGRNFSGVEKALDLATEKYLPAIQDSEGAFKYNPDHAKGKPTLTGAALLAMQIWKGKGSPNYDKGLAYLAKVYKNPTPGANFYAPYYNTQAFFMHEGAEWENYNKQFQPRLLDAQNDDGSWLRPGAAGQGNADAQFLNTAWAILMLEVYYRYLPTTDKVSGLKKR